MSPKKMTPAQEQAFFLKALGIQNSVPTPEALEAQKVP